MVRLDNVEKHSCVMHQREEQTRGMIFKFQMSFQEVDSCTRSEQIRHVDFTVYEPLVFAFQIHESSLGQV